VSASRGFDVTPVIGDTACYETGGDLEQNGVPLAARRRLPNQEDPMRPNRSTALFLGAWLALGPVSAALAQGRDDARPRDVQRLQEELANLDDALSALEPSDRKADEFRQRAEEIREEAVYVKVKMRRQSRRNGGGTGVSLEEVEDLQRSIAELRQDMERSFDRRDDREVRLAEGTEIVVRLDEPLYSRTARREDRVDASVYQPVRAQGRLAIPAGSQVRGIVREAEPAERPSRGGRLELQFDAIFLDRTRLDLRAQVVGILEEGDDHRSTGEKAGIGAVLGGVIGGILGGKKGAFAGVLIGGTGAVAATKGEEVDLPAGTIVTLRLDRPLVIPRR